MFAFTPNSNQPLRKFQLKVKAWNINGYNGRDIGNKMLDPEFLKEVTPYDIVALFETHAFNTELSLPGFKLISRKDRRVKEKSKKSFGGIAVFVKENIAFKTRIVHIQTNNPDVILVQINKNLLNVDQHVHVAFSYLSPDNRVNKDFSKVYFTRFRNDIEKFMSRGPLMIMGDLNARTGTCHDFIDITNDVLNNDDSLHSDDSINGFRNSEDKRKPCKRGKKVLEMCTELDISILNGRCVGDLFGKVTCFRSNGCSVVDYGLCSNDFINNISHFKVNTLLPWLSDHCAIELTIDATIGSTTGMGSTKKNMSDIPTYFKWDTSCTQKFVDILNSDKYKTELEKFVGSIKNESFPFLKLNEIFRNICIEADLKQLPKVHKHKYRFNKIWFDTECQKAKNKLRNLSNQVRSDRV